MQVPTSQRNSYRVAATIGASAGCATWTNRAVAPSWARENEDRDMGKYFIAWLLGVPAIVLVVIYLLFH
jgi:hypothetical protein